jgi:hypothetical protein
VRLGDARREVEADADRRMARGDVGDRYRGALARVYRGQVGMVTPAANPSAWHHSCAGTNQGEKVPHVWRDSDPSHWCCPHGCVSFQSPESSALWGHEWKAVAVLAYTFKVLLSRQAGKAILVSRFVDDGVDRCMCRCRWSGSSREQREQNRSTALCPIHN